MDSLAAVESFGIALERIARGLANGRFRVEEGELQKLCCRCREYWPADREFFYPAYNVPDQLHCYCKACYVEVRWPNGRSTRGVPEAPASPSQEPDESSGPRSK